MSEKNEIPPDFSESLRGRLWDAERLRLLAALGLLFAGAGVTFIREFLVRQSQDLIFLSLLILVVLVGVESAWFFLLRLAHDRSRRWTTFLLGVEAVLEANFATAIILLMTFQPVPGPYKALVAPILSLYFLFAILSSLRMRPWVCLVYGAAGFVGYFSVVLATFALFPDRQSSAPLERPFFLSIAIMIFFAGLLAALVSRQVLKSVSQSIEASLKRQKLESDMALAREIQQSLLPAAPPRCAGFDVAGRADPADQAGGDCYDWLTLPDGRAVVTLADVTGHGVGPALLASNLHAYVQATCSSDSSLSRWLTRLNQYLAADLLDGKFATFVAVLLDPAGGTVEILSAGHGPILLYQQKHGRVVELGSHGPPLGVLEEMEFPEPHRVEMSPGDVLALVTDGFFEQVNARDEPFGIERLKESVLRHAAGSASDVVAGLYRDVRGFFAGVNQDDDLTAAVIRRMA